MNEMCCGERCIIVFVAESYCGEGDNNKNAMAVGYNLKKSTLFCHIGGKLLQEYMLPFQDENSLK